MDSKGQGLPITTIVIVIIAVLTLTLVILFATGTLGDLFGKAKPLVDTAVDEAVAYQTKCSQLCILAKRAASSAEYASSGFCSQTFDVIVDEQPTTKQCWESPINYDCTVEINGETHSGLGGKCEQ
jgi:hypothetical protein